MEEHVDLADPDNTRSVVETRYDSDGKKVFRSYAQRNATPVDASLQAEHWKYDALDREVEHRQDNGPGQLPSTTSTEYLPDFVRKVTNPRGHATTYEFQTFDNPSEDNLVRIRAPETVWVGIERDVFGKALSISRGGVYRGTVQQATRFYTYDVHHRLCKTVEPETAATVQAYDQAGNVAWRAGGQAFAPGGGCNQAEVHETSKVSFRYDDRDRLLLTAFGDSSPSIQRTYTPDGLLDTITSWAATWQYKYNHRRLLEREHLSIAGQPFSFDYTIDAHGNVARLKYANGLVVDYAPSAFGLPTKLSEHIQNVRYHPNGALSGYALPNGRSHTVTLNGRGLPELWSYSGALNYKYEYDANGNVVAITDLLTGLDSRGMTYDGLDRLITVSGRAGGVYDYDALDNLIASSVWVTGGKVRDVYGVFDPATNRPYILNVAGVNLNLSYDANGNLKQRGDQHISFDLGNRLVGVDGRAAYAHDGHGRRFYSSFSSGRWQQQAYSKAGRLLLTVDSQRGTTAYMYLGGRVVAEANDITGVSYPHTDALGSPMVRTDALGSQSERTYYEAYGATASGFTPTGIGFTGHVNDAETGMVYMQQRYYDPIAGRFLSVDPVTVDLRTGDNFGPYAYVDNNPYRYIDPHGQIRVEAASGNGAGGSSVSNNAGLGGGGYAGASSGTGARVGAGGNQAGATVTRYMGPGEAKVAAKTGSIPNVGIDGKPRPTHVTTDKPLSSASQAKKKYELPTEPTHSATVPANRVTDLGPAPDGRGTTSGGGSQAATNQPIPVKPSEIKELKN